MERKTDEKEKSKQVGLSKIQTAGNLSNSSYIQGEGNAVEKRTRSSRGTGQNFPTIAREGTAKYRLGPVSDRHLLRVMEFSELGRREAEEINHKDGETALLSRGRRNSREKTRALEEKESGEDNRKYAKTGGGKRAIISQDPPSEVENHFELPKSGWRIGRKWDTES